MNVFLFCQMIFFKTWFKRSSGGPHCYQMTFLVGFVLHLVSRPSGSGRRVRRALSEGWDSAARDPAGGKGEGADFIKERDGKREEYQGGGIGETCFVGSNVCISFTFCLSLLLSDFYKHSTNIVMSSNCCFMSRTQMNRVIGKRCVSVF